MDKIIIEDLQVYAHHGVLASEKISGQMFLVSLEIGMDLEKAAQNDDLNETVSYAGICDDVQTVLQAQNFDLIEAAAMKIISYLFTRYEKITEIQVLLKKPWAPMPYHLKYAAVELKRKRGDRNEW